MKSLFKKLLVPHHLEYLALDKDFLIQERDSSLDPSTNEQTQPLESDPNPNLKSKPKKVKQKSALEYFGTNLNKKAEAGALDPLYGREPQLERMTVILGRRQKNNPVIINGN